MDMTVTTQTLDNEALAVGSPHTGWQIKSWHHETASKRAAWQFLFSHPRSGWNEVGRGSHRGTCQQISFIAALERYCDLCHVLSKSLHPPSSITSALMPQT